MKGLTDKTKLLEVEDDVVMTPSNSDSEQEKEQKIFLQAEVDKMIQKMEESRKATIDELEKKHQNAMELFKDEIKRLTK